MSDLRPGIQILYVPMHAEGDESHPDVEAGFVTSLRGDHALCRYWSKHHIGALRTTACSELTPINCLVAKKTTSQYMIDLWLVSLM